MSYAHPWLIGPAAELRQQEQEQHARQQQLHHQQERHITARCRSLMNGTPLPREPRLSSLARAGAYIRATPVSP
ncbi:hypothetical protein [Synechococcus sp. 1G10]|uniref:hypothetical protein n=1 Tax=Synechococcus sp. 1G10 TaxID=2025605 RepID=UPI000B991710|nr:hypothetical protein [Synechococcus sp. 1G10]